MAGACLSNTVKELNLENQIKGVSDFVSFIVNNRDALILNRITQYPLDLSEYQNCMDNQSPSMQSPRLCRGFRPTP